MSISTFVDGAAMCEVLGHFATGVVVVTAVGEDGPLGFTCQSFSSLSLDPPLISLAPARSSSTWPRIREVGTFCVNVLADDHEHRSVRFARSGVDTSTLWATRASRSASAVVGSTAPCRSTPPTSARQVGGLGQ